MHNFKKLYYLLGERLDNGQLVFGMIDRLTNDCILFPVEKRDGPTLLQIICDNVEPGSIIYSDGWAAYRQLA